MAKVKMSMLLKQDFSLGSLAEMLRSMGVKNVSFLYRMGFGIAKRQEFYRDLASVIRSGIRLENALIDIRHAKAAPDYIINTVLAKIRRGKGFSLAMEGLVPDQERMVLKSGEEGADADGFSKSLLILSETVGSMKKGQAEVWKAITYPVTVLSGVIGFIVFYSNKMLPSFTGGNFIDIDKLKGVAKFEYYFFLTVNHYWGLIPVLVVISAYTLIWSFSHEFPFREKLDKFPPWSIYRLWVGAQFLFALSSLMKAGIPTLKAIMILQRHANPWLSKRIKFVRAAVSRGDSLSKAMSKSPYEFPDKRMIARLQIREEHADIVVALDEFSKDWQERGEQMIASRTAALNAVLIFLAALLMAIAGVGPYAFEGSGSSGF